MLLFKNARIISHDKIFKGDVLTYGSEILKVATKIDNVNVPVYNCKGNYLSSGFIDLHVHGGGGLSAMSNKNDIIMMAKAHAIYGTTSILPTALAAPINQLIYTMKDIRAAKKDCYCSNILGVNLEGPFISEDMCGAQNTDNLLIPSECEEEDINKLFLYSDIIKMIGIAPELDGAYELAKKFKKRGIVVSIAHSSGDYDTAIEALAYGFSDITHIYNACTSCYKDDIFRKAGTVEAGLTNDNYTVQVIADLRHLPLGVLKLIYKAKGADKMYLVTDGLEYSAMKIRKGQRFVQKNGVEVIYEDEVLKLADRSCLAGSTATSNRLVRNMYKQVGVPLPEAVRMMTETPARVIGIDDHKGKIKKGYDADIIVFDDDINIIKTMVMGNDVYNRT